MENIEDTDFNTDNINRFFYTSDKQIKKMDDEFILSKITEKYPDFTQDSDENILKQIITVIVSDSSLINDINDNYGIDPLQLIRTIYRNYEFVFNKCFITKLQKTIKGRKYARKYSRKRTRR